MSIILALISYLYNPSDWQHYPRLDNIRNFTADAFQGTYLVTSNAIVELDDQSNLPRQIFTSSEGLPSTISLAIYDTDLASFWVVDSEGNLYNFNTIGGMARKIYLPQSVPVKSLGIDGGYVFLDYGTSSLAVNKRSEQTDNTKPDSSSVTWVGVKDLQKAPRNYPLLNPWYLVDNRMHQIPYTMVFKSHNKAYVSVQGYGYLVFDALAWREILDYQSPSAIDVRSFFAADSSIYIFGKNGVDQLVPGDERIVFHAFDRWGTTSSQTPSWSYGLMDRLRRTTYNKVKLVGNNLFLMLSHAADVVNLQQNVISQINLEATLYDVDFNKDSLYVATDNGVTLTIIPSGQPKPLEDERGRLVKTDVLAIVRGARARYFWTGNLVVKQSKSGWTYYVAPGFMPVPQRSVTGRDSLIILGGKGGVTIYNPETYFQVSLTRNEGLLSDEVTAVYLEGHYLWIATDGGISRFDLSAVIP